MKKEKICLCRQRKKEKIFKITYCFITLRSLLILLSLFLFIISYLTGCLSVVEETGKFLDGTSRKNKQISLYRSIDSFSTNIDISILINKSNEKSMLISISKYPMIKFLASYNEEEGKIHFVSLEYLSGSFQGWNEFSLAVLGEGNFELKDQILFTITGEIEPVQIFEGRIQRRDNRITGDEALTALRNRRERILALTEWMSSYIRQDEIVTSYDDGIDVSIRNFTSIEDFENYWKSILLPETVSKKKRPENWQQEGDIFKRAESINWNTSYTERIFPEELRPIRDSGTILRDWEEALPWIYMEYEWENIVKLLKEQIILQKIK